MTWFELIKVEWKTQGSGGREKESFYVKNKVWNKEAGLEMLSGTPTMPEFEEYIGRQLTIDDMSYVLYDPNSDNVVVERFGKEAIENLANRSIEESFVNGKLDIEQHSKLVSEGISEFLRYLKYYPNGKYANEIRGQLSGRETRRNRMGSYDLV
tara:strand:+ start:836 stop:1297 length:462 start_codon:yes stop_codon:yes gene_type:complete